MDRPWGGLGRPLGGSRGWWGTQDTVGGGVWLSLGVAVDRFGGSLGGHLRSLEGLEGVNRLLTAEALEVVRRRNRQGNRHLLGANLAGD